MAPVKSVAQRRLMGMAQAIKEGGMDPGESPQAAQVASSMKGGDLMEMATTKEAGLPQRVPVRRSGSNKQQRKPGGVRKANMVPGMRRVG